MVTIAGIRSLAIPSSDHLDCLRLRRAHLLQPLEAQRLAQPIEPEALINQIGQFPILRCSGSCLGPKDYEQLQEKTLYKSAGYAGSTEVWKQMWKHRLRNPNKLHILESHGPWFKHYVPGFQTARSTKLPLAPSKSDAVFNN